MELFGVGNGFHGKKDDRLAFAKSNDGPGGGSVWLGGVAARTRNVSTLASSFSKRNKPSSHLRRI